VTTEQIKIEINENIAKLTLPNGEVWLKGIPEGEDPEDFVAGLVAMIQDCFAGKARNFTLLKLK